jgi:hypothetical protein
VGDCVVFKFFLHILVAVFRMYAKLCSIFLRVTVVKLLCVLYRVLHRGAMSSFYYVAVVLSMWLYLYIRI